MRIFIFRGSARYSGRIDADLEFGDRVVLVKDDGTVVLHGRGGVQPRNWMPAGSVWEEPHVGYVRIVHDARGEMLELFVAAVLHDTSHDLTHDGRLVKLGSEREFANALATRLSVLEPGLRLVGREFRTPAGPVDLLARDSRGEPVIVEVKRARPTGLEVLYQLRRYCDALPHMPAWQGTQPRGILVAPGCGRVLSAAIEQDAHISYQRVRFQDLLARDEDQD